MNNSCWCIECEAIPSATCESQHSIVERSEEVEEIKALKMEVSTTLSQAIGERKQILHYLKNVIASNEKSLDKLQSLAKTKLPTCKIGPMKKNLGEVLKRAKEELKEANKLCDSASNHYKVFLIFLLKVNILLVVGLSLRAYMISLSNF